MDIMNGAGEASELIFRAERLRALSLASQLQKAIALHLVGDLELHRTTLDLACAAVRSALMFGAIGCEYAVVHKILKYYPVKATGTGSAANFYRKSVVWANSVSVREDLGGRRI